MENLTFRIGLEMSITGLAEYLREAWLKLLKRIGSGLYFCIRKSKDQELSQP